MGSKPRIQYLKFSAFRGAVKPVTFEFRADNPIVLIFGENGSGKSTIADAIDFLCNNEFGSVSLRGGTRARSHIVALAGKAGDLEVEMGFAGKTWRARLVGGKPATTPDGPPRAFVLRRANITRVMEATDSDRYKSLKEFITVPNIESSEAALRSLCRTISKELDDAIKNKQTAESTLIRFWEAEGKPNTSAQMWARSAIAQPIGHWQAQLQADRDLAEALERTERSDQQVTAARSALAHAQAALDELQEELRRATQGEASADLVKVLESAQTYLHNHPESSACPVCGKDEPHAALVSRLDAQLARLRLIQTLHRQVEQGERGVQQARGAVDQAKEFRRTEHGRLAAQLQAAPPLPDLLPDHLPGDADDEPALALFFQRVAAQRPALDARMKEADKAIDQRHALATHLATIDTLGQTTIATDRLLQRLRAMLEVVESERKQFVQNTVDEISMTVSDFYDRIHPDEPLGKPSFGIKAHTAGSLTLTGAFGDSGDVPPAAYYSEAHLDTLGLCVYLALAQQMGNALVVLDDVLTSVDDPHLDRVIDLINEEAPGFGQVIITTHSRAWFDRIRLGQGMKAETIELYGWTLQNGMNHSAALMAVDELRATVYAPRLDRQSVASQAGVLLEQLLDGLTLRYSCSLPRRRPAEYTLGDLAQGIDRKLRPLLRTEHVDTVGNVTPGVELYALITAATQDTWIRNQVGAHFNASAAGIADSMVRKFGESVLALADAMLCPECRQLPRKDKSGSFWECGGGCGRLRQYPLRTPS